MKQNNFQTEDQAIKTVKVGTLYRNSRLEIPQEHDTRSLWVAFSSEEPIERFFGVEILDHRENSIKLDWLKSGRAPLLLDHDPQKQIGVVESAAVDGDGKARAKIRFSKSKLAESVYQDVVDGIRSNISVGYHYLKHGIILESEGKKGEPSIYRITAWQPLEISMVSIPADHSVGVGRSLEENNKETIYQVRQNMNITENNPEITEIQTDTGFNPNKIRQDETARISELIAIGDKHNMRAAAMEYIRQGKTIDSFRMHVLEQLSQNEPIKTVNPDNVMIGMSQQEARSFSIIRAIRAAMTGNWSDAGLEKEASAAAAKQLGREPSSFFVPLDVMVDMGRNGSNSQVRSLEKLTNIAGGYLVSTDYLSGNFIELLRNKMLVKQMGARVMSGLKGEVAIPKQTGGATTYWVGEGQSPLHSQQTFGQVTLTPRSVAAFTDFTRKLVLQSSPDIETLVRNDLATVIALELDRVAIAGSGLAAEPPGILATAGTGKIAINVEDPDNENYLNWGKIVDLETAIAAKNADIATLGYLCNAGMRGLLKQMEKAEHTAQFIWENSSEPGFGMLNGYRVGTTNQMPASTIIFGNFADLIIGQWGVMDVLVDPYTLGTSGGIRIRIMQDVDVAVRHAESFVAASV